MPFVLATAAKNSRLLDLSNFISGGANPAKLIIYSGVQPANGGAVTTQINLAQVNLPQPLHTSITNAVLTVASIPVFLATQSGTATWFRVQSFAGVFILDGEVGGVGSGKPCEVSTTNFITGSDITVQSFTIAE